MLKTQQNIDSLRDEVMNDISPYFSHIDDIAERNTLKILSAFKKYQLSEYHFRSTSGYGYGDAGRDKLDEIWANIFNAESALVRSQFASGTHAISTALFGILRPGDELLSITGAPYDTLQSVIGNINHSAGSLKEWGITYKEIPFGFSGINYETIKQAITDRTAAVLIQRSRGYSMQRPSLKISEISEICKFVKTVNPKIICFVDNCYGEFVETLEPPAVGADLIAGSLIKNPGGGIAVSGGYVAGKNELVELVAYRLTAPGIGKHVGATLTDNRLFFQGLFIAPHVVAQALKSAVFAASLFSKMGYRTNPLFDEKRSDIIQAIELKTPEKMIAFCQALQELSPVDAFVRPEPAPMPGYSDDVIMAGGTFVQGSSIELSADGPIRPPYSIYLQGGITFEHAVLCIMNAAKAISATN